jgi:hypothetical protein
MGKTAVLPRARVRYPLVVAAFAAMLLGLVVAPSARALVPTTFDTNMWGANGRVRAIVQTPNAIYLAGKFTALVSPTGQTMARQNLAAIDPVTGAPLPFVANVNRQVWNIAVSPDYSTVYAVGDFTQANGTLRQRAAAFDASTGALRSWRANLNVTGFGVAVLGNRVYLGGDFTSVNSTPKTRLAAVDATTGNLLTNFTATANDSVEVITPTNDGSRLLIGGLFTSVSGSPNSTQRKMASLNPVTGALQPWADHPNFEVFDIEVSNTQAFVAGGGSGGHAQAWNLSNGRSQWSASSDGDAVAVEFQNGVLYVGGHFTKWKGVQSGHIVAVQPTNGTQIPWGITVNSNLGIFSMASFDGHLSIGGDFTRVNGQTRNHYARFSETVDSTPPTTPGKPTASLASPTSVNVTWTSATDNLITQIIYDVYRDGDTTTPIATFTSAAKPTVTFTDTGLSPNTTHTWQVRASDGANDSDLSPLSDPFTLPPSDSPLLTSLQMLDANANGLVDTVTAQFSDNVSCTAPCLAPWTLANVPSDGSLSSVDVSGNTATLHLTEGAGAPNTAVGTFTVALASDPNGIVGPEPNPASFGPTSPADKAGPVPVDISSVNHGTTVGVMQVSDTFIAVFSEPILASTVHAANVKELDVIPTDTLTLVGLAESAIDLGESGIVPSGQNATYQNATLTLSNGNRTITSTIAGSCDGNACTTLGVDQPSPVTFVPEQTLTDAAGNGAVGSIQKTLQLY